MSTTTEHDIHTPAAAFLARLEAAWNEADGQRFGAEFAEPTDFVTIRGEHVHGGPALIGDGHQRIFDTIYRGSRNRIELERVRQVAPGCLLVHATSTLDAPSGPLAGRHRATMTALLVRQEGAWKGTAFHNTLLTA